MRASGVKELISFVNGLADDAEAIANACTESWSNGMVEGFNHKLKWIKRSSYGQAAFPLPPTPSVAPSGCFGALLQGSDTTLLPEARSSYTLGCKPWLNETCKGRRNKALEEEIESSSSS